MRRAASAYRGLLKEWTSIEGDIGADKLYPANVDGELLHPPPQGQEREWLEKLRARVAEWMAEWERREGAAKERLRERLQRVVRRGKEAAEALLEGNLHPWDLWTRMLETGAGRELASGIGKTLVVFGAILMLGLWLKRKA